MCALTWRHVVCIWHALTHTPTGAAAKLLARGTAERHAQRGVLALAARRLAGEPGAKLTPAQAAAAVRVQRVMAALTAALLRLDGMLAVFANVMPA
jgi:hypothetical protein